MDNKNNLKTLKDLQDLSNPCMKCGSVRCAICNDDLREEAVKTLKTLSDSKKEGFKLMYMTYYEQFRYTEDWIKHFFNITEEDLK